MLVSYRRIVTCDKAILLYNEIMVDDADYFCHHEHLSEAGDLSFDVRAVCRKNLHHILHSPILEKGNKNACTLCI